ncbi:MAG: hypothetical protein NZ990_02660 [Myxococcota bacterium]|nr:hypothetical protein [Myxococcota bacterium]
MSYDFQVCPSCRDEFTLAVFECSKCGVALVSPDLIAPEPEPEDFPEVDVLECVRVGPLPWTRAISAALTEAGIAHRVEPDTRSVAEGGVDPERFGGAALYGTWVRPEELAGARAVDSEIFAIFEAEAAPVAAGSEACPACETPLAADALECPDCGLVFG